MFSGYMGYYILIGAIGLISSIVSSKLKSKFAFYSKVHLRNGMTGAEIAEKMLADNGIRDVKVISVKGQLTDHYNPVDKTVNLSEVVYSHANAAAAAVAAHECGHAVQHATAYSYLTMRSKLVPVVQVTSSMSQWVIIGGIALMASGALGASGLYVAIAGLVMMGFATLFSFITLPVEYDASNRALAWLKAKNIVTPEEYKGSEDALKWAARTYLVAAIGALASLLYWAMQILGRRD
ncbi:MULTISPECIES: zinc metallopeptidase [unclassified Olleya]|uniref:zinc metallopeptidase n=1 Tax=unclassified Olleya TaxID=2615019 RepID=UPI0025D40E6A|nr:zinc metallopeptidase [Olleya sp. UBA1516]|tara:strand:- start:3626 stop:4336 length:711 start_codon:yes stop_codon:yes gene_type:complete